MNVLYGVHMPKEMSPEEYNERIYTLGFAPRQPTHTYPVSRDWEDLDCGAVACVNNKLNKCTVPSLCKLDNEGKCVGYKRKE